MAFIYMITNNITSKKYVGKTVHTVEYRWKLHQKNYPYVKCPLYSAIKKYGIQNFYIQTLEECPDSQASEREQYWIKYYDTYANGYNATLGGEGCPKYNYDEILLLWKEGYHIKQIAQKLKSNNNTIGKILRDVGISKEEIYHRGAGNNRKIIGQFTLDDKLIKIYPSASEAARQVVNQNAQSNISACCRGKLKTAYGYKWKYLEEEYNGQKYELLKEYQK